MSIQITTRTQPVSVIYYISFIQTIRARAQDETSQCRVHENRPIQQQQRRSIDCRALYTTSIRSTSSLRYTIHQLYTVCIRKSNSCMRLHGCDSDPHRLRIWSGQLRGLAAGFRRVVHVQQCFCLLYNKVRVVEKEQGLKGVLPSEARKAHTAAVGFSHQLEVWTVGLSSSSWVWGESPANERYSCISKSPGSLFCYVIKAKSHTESNKGEGAWGNANQKLHEQGSLPTVPRGFNPLISLPLNSQRVY